MAAALPGPAAAPTGPASLASRPFSESLSGAWFLGSGKGASPKPLTPRPSASDGAGGAGPRPGVPAFAPPARRPAGAPPPELALRHDEPMLTSELVLRVKKARGRSRLVSGVAVLLAAVAVGGGVYFGVAKWRGPSAPRAKGHGDDGAAAGTFFVDASGLVMREPKPAPAAAAVPAAGTASAARSAADRPKRPRLTAKERGMLDLLSRKEDAAVGVQAEDAAALDTTQTALDADAVQATLARNTQSFSACVTRAVAANPGGRVNGRRVNLELTVKPSGRVAKAALAEPEIASSQMGRCIADAAQRMVFPGFDGEPIDISVPIMVQVAY